MSDPLPAGGSVVVVGGGVVGAATAYAATRAGFAVTLVTAGQVGDGATAGNAGLLVPADSVVWAGPANARAVPATLVGRGGSSIRVAWGNPATVPWGLAFLAAATARRYAAACRAAHALSVHSLAVTQAWAGQVGADVERTGMVFLLGSADDVAALRAARAPLADAGEQYEELPAGRLAALDPAYASLPAGLRAVLAPGAARGDSRAFARALADAVRAAGGAVREGEPVDRLITDAGRVVGVRTTAGPLPADAVVLAAGTGTRALARGAGVRVPVLPVKGYAATVPVADPARTPRIGGVLEHEHVAFSPQGDRLRLTTGAEIGRRDHDVPDAARQHLRAAAEHLFPGALDWSGARFRAEHRPMTPGGLPLVGPTARPGLHLNAGHGSLGWTHAAGSADLLAALLAGAAPAVDPAPYRPA